MEIENLTVTLKVVNGEYIVDDTKSEEKNLYIGHIENVLNYYGKKGWILKQVSPEGTELCFYRNKMCWLKRFLIGPRVFHRRRNIYEKGGKYEVGADTPFGEISSFEGLYLDSMQEAISYLISKYGYTFICQSPGEKIGDETLIIVYLYKIEN